LLSFIAFALECCRLGAIKTRWYPISCSWLF